MKFIKDSNWNRKVVPTVTENSILGFFEEYRFLSNFHVCDLSVDGILFKNSESAYMAGKTKNDKIKKVFSTLTPDLAKALGQEIKLREDWEEIKLNHMYKCIYAKFSQNEDLKQKLLNTGFKYLEETNYWGDIFWGFCIHKQEGENNLGKILMKVREELISIEKND